MEHIEKLDNEKVLSFIDRIQFFDRFTAKEKQKIVRSYTNCFVFNKGEIIIQEGSKDTAFFIILNGNVSVTKVKGMLPIANLGAGDIFGEISFLTGKPRTSTVIADEMVIVIKIDQQMLRELDVSIREKIKDNIIEKLVERLNRMNDTFVSTII
jgi:CRP/FNR family cyclic AMP-dependent transcriptional regulator